MRYPVKLGTKSNSCWYVLWVPRCIRPLVTWWCMYHGSVFEKLLATWGDSGPSSIQSLTQGCSVVGSGQSVLSCGRWLGFRLCVRPAVT